MRLIAPGFIEHDFSDQIDNIVPTRGYQMLPMVGIGGSAGSIPALQEFFEAMPPESGMAFVVILHLSPERDSLLAEMFQRSTAMRVVQAQDGQKVEANTVYVIPPGKHLASVDGHLELINLEAARGSRFAVDLFFRTLADTHGPHAAAVVLSGADGDGALGIKRIKERGGLTIVQDPDEAEHPSMPRTAIETGMVDWVLRVAQMPARLLEYRKKEAQLRLPSEEGPQPAAAPSPPPDEDERALREVLSYLRARTGRDFSYYKRATIVRRVSRRMQVNSVVTLPDYLNLLRTHPGESGALLQDLLISVTNFFRDRDSFEALERRIPELFAGKSVSDAVRVWVPACATGEEAYSIAMLLLEHAAMMDAPPAIQVFATDLDEDAIAVGREALYPVTIGADVSEERLRRFFSKEHRGYRVRRALRERVLFAMHDLLKDAPFSRLDLVSCRNLLIYLARDAQTRALETFHFALRPKALLFLGSSESIDEDSPVFRPVDIKHRLYVQTPTLRAGLAAPVGPSTLARAFQAQQRAQGAAVVHGEALDQQAMLAAKHEAELRETQTLSWEELHFKLIERFAPPSLIVDRDYEILHVSENAGRFLHFHGGEPSRNLIHVVHPMLRVELRAALFRAAQTNAPVEVFRVPVELEGEATAVDIRVSPAQEIAPDFLLVVFSVRQSGNEGETARSEPEPAVRHLEREIEQLKLRLRDTVEQYEASTEELKASNEELQAMNEELRSTTEELETSREELQSVNEELTTVNQELKSKVDQLRDANSDLNNLMAATAIATIFLDRQLTIMRYTPSAVELFHLIPSDLGRPLTDLTHQLNYPELKDDAERVLRKGAPVRREVSEGTGRWFLAQLLPYRTAEDRIAGAVLTFIDITERREAERAVEASRRQMEAVLRHMPIGVILSEAPSGKSLYHNEEAERLVGYALPMQSYREFDQLGAISSDARPCRTEDYPAARCLLHGETVHQEEVIHRAPDGRTTRLAVSSAPIRNEAGEITSAVTALIDIEARRSAEDALRGSQERYATLFDLVPVAVYTCDADGTIGQYNRQALELWGEVPDKSEKFCGSFKLFHPDGRPMALADCPMARIFHGEHLEPNELEIIVEQRSGSRRNVIVNPQALRDEQGNIVGAISCLYDITDRKRAEEALWESQRRLRLAQEAGNVGIWDWDAATGQTYWSDTTWKMHGYESAPAKAANDFWSAHLHREDRERVLGNLARLLASKENNFNEEFRIVRADGTVRWIQSVAKVTRDATGKPQRMAGVNLDVTDRKTAEEALAASQERLRLVVENAREYAIFSLDRNRAVTSWNAGAERLLGWTEAEIIGQTADVIFTPEDRAQGVPEQEASQALGEERAIDERWHVRKDGSRFWGSGVMMAMRDSAGQVIGLVKIFRDDTDAREAKQALEQSRQELWEALQETERARADAEAAGLAKDHFLAVLSHELRTPLTPVLMAVQTLVRRKDLPAPVTEALEMIRRNVQLEAHFIDDLLDLTRVTRGKLELIREPIDLHEAVRRAVDISMGDLEGKLQRLTLNLTANRSHLEGDFMRLQQVFWNLLKNASKFTPQGGSICVTSRNEPGLLVVEISDTGVGFAPEDAEKIFDAFTQANRAVTREFGGLGLGLAISKASIDAHHGRLRATSPGPGKGATFTVELPVTSS